MTDALAVIQCVLLGALGPHMIFNTPNTTENE